MNKPASYAPVPYRCAGVCRWVSEKNPSRNCPKGDSSNAPTVIWPLYGGQTGTKVVRFSGLQEGYVAGTLEPFRTVSLGTWVNNKGTTRRERAEHRSPGPQMLAESISLRGYQLGGV